MAKVSSYEITHLEGRLPTLPAAPSEERAVFQLTDATWRIAFRDSGRGLSCGLLRSRLGIEALDEHSCRASVAGSSKDGFEGTLVLKAPAETVRLDLEARLASLERCNEVVAATESGQWWRDSRVFSELDWAQTRSIAGVRYRAGWWGTGRLKPSMLAKVLDFGPAGIVLRGWRIRFVIPWDAIATIKALEGDRWLSEGPNHRRSSGTTLIIRSVAGQDAVFYTPLLSPSVVRTLLEPLTDRLGSMSSSRWRSLSG